MDTKKVIIPRLFINTHGLIWVTMYLNKLQLLLHKPHSITTVSLLLLGPAIVSWVIYVVIFGIFVSKYGIDDEQFFWSPTVIGPIIFPLAIIHSLLWCKEYSIVAKILSSIIFFLFIFYITSFGSAMVQCYQYCRDEFWLDKYSIMLIVGGFITSFFWAAHMAFWPWYSFLQSSYSIVPNNSATLPPTYSPESPIIRLYGTVF